MRVSAILVMSDRQTSIGGGGDEGIGAASNSTSKGSVATAEIMGQSLFGRTVARLRQVGIRTISVIGGRDILSLAPDRDLAITVADSSFARWLAAQQTLREHGSRGMDIVLMIGMGAYFEWNVVETLKFHLSTRAPLTQMEDSQGPLDLWMVDSKWFRTAAAGCNLPFRYGEFPGLPVPFPMDGYVNRLEDALDLRRLVVDAFSGRCEFTPPGREVRPGIWLDVDARVHKLARLVAPVYVGRSTKVGPSAVITRFSNLERGCQIGEGTVIEQATVLPHTRVGAYLEVSRAVVDGNRFADLERNVTFQIDDTNLFCDTTPLRRRVPAHRRFPAQPERTKEGFAFEYWSRTAGRLSEVLFKG